MGRMRIIFTVTLVALFLRVSAQELDHTQYYLNLPGLNASYAYHLPITPRVNMSFGTQVGYSSQRIDFTGYVVRDQVNDTFYQQIMQAGQGNAGSFRMDFGYVLYSSKFYLGLSSNGL